MELVQDDASLLIVVMETNPVYWASPKGKSSGTAAAQGLKRTVEQLRKLDPKTEEAAAAAAGKAPNGGGPVTSPFAGALSLALCYCHRLTSAPLFSAKPRILCLQGSEDSPSQYVAMMNAIFSAQRIGIPIDSCILGDYDSAFLQQAAHLTNGVYYKPHRGEALLQYLLSVSGADLFTRQHMRLSASRSVDFRASCFCHKRPIEIGYVCSVCLSIFCEERLVCPTCGADYKAGSSRTEEGGRQGGGGDGQ